MLRSLVPEQARLAVFLATKRVVLTMRNKRIIAHISAYALMLH